jgi:beta-fructofuranosidase
MAFDLPDKWIWDFWFARDGEHFHVFYLQAPSSLRPHERHHRASIGHAVSTDLRSWTVVADAIRPGVSGEWDDLATWTGSVIEHDGRWHMLYTGISHRESGLTQRIGLASSDDLINWSKHPANPVMRADPRWYARYDSRVWRDESWRDPWLFHDSSDNHVHALITARGHSGPVDGRGVVAHARSLDLVHWEILPPLIEPGDFAQVECPQLVEIDGFHYLLFSSLGEDHSRARIERVGGAGQTGTFAFSSRERYGPFISPAGPLIARSAGQENLYAGRLVEDKLGGWWFMAFLAGAEEPMDGQFDDGTFVGGLTDPYPVVVAAPGELRVDPTADGPLPDGRPAAVRSFAGTVDEGNGEPRA